jgi:hypothetical protein
VLVQLLLQQNETRNGYIHVKKKKKNPEVNIKIINSLALNIKLAIKFHLIVIQFMYIIHIMS